MPHFRRGRCVSRKHQWLFFLLLSTISFCLASLLLLSTSWSPWELLVQKPKCLRHTFEGVVLVIVYNHPFYSSVPLLKRLYSGAFSNIMVCGAKADKLYHGIEYVYHHEGYFAYMCLVRAMEKYPITPSYHGYLLINDDVMFNFWNFKKFDRSKIWEGPKVPIQYAGFKPNGKWYWWKSRWGMNNCQKAYNEISFLRDKLDSWTTMNVTFALDVLSKNGNGRHLCYRGRSDVFYVPVRFSNMFEILATIFYKHRVFLEIAVPTMLRMLDLESNFDYIPGIYLPGKRNDSLVKNSRYFRQIYSIKQYFVHPMKLGYADADLNKDFVETHILNHVSIATTCK